MNLPPPPSPPRPRPQGHQEAYEDYERYCDDLEADYIRKLDAYEEFTERRMTSELRRGLVFSGASIALTVLCVVGIGAALVRIGG